MIKGPVVFCDRSPIRTGSESQHNSLRNLVLGLYNHIDTGSSGEFSDCNGFQIGSLIERY